MSDDFPISELRREDYPTWKNLYADYAKVWDEPMTEDGLAGVWACFDEQKHQAYGLGLRNGEALIGFAHYMLYPCTQSTKMICYVQDLYVLPDYRGRGLGKKVIQYIAEIGRTKNWRKIHWETRETNKEAQRSYDKIASRESGWVHYKLEL